MYFKKGKLMFSVWGSSSHSEEYIADFEASRPFLKLACLKK